MATYTIPPDPNPYCRNGQWYWHDETFLEHGPYPDESHALEPLLRHMNYLNPTQYQKMRGYLHAAIAKFLQLLSRHARR